MKQRTCSKGLLKDRVASSRELLSSSSFQSAAPGSRAPRGSPPQDLCVIIPAFNEASVIAETLSCVKRAAAFLRDHSRHSVSVIVVDNKSTDRTVDIAREHGVLVISESERNIAAVRNAGARAAPAGVLVFLDADTMVPETFLQRIMQVMDDPNCVGGAVDTVYKPRRFFVRLYLRLWRVLGVLAGMAQGAAQFCRRDFLFQIGGYDETLYMGEDVDFYWRMRRTTRKPHLRCCFIRELRVIPSSRRFDHWPFWRTVVWTNPLTVLLRRRRKEAWGGWYQHPPR